MRRPKASVHRLSTDEVSPDPPARPELALQRHGQPARRTSGDHCGTCTSRPQWAPPRACPETNLTLKCAKKQGRRLRHPGRPCAAAPATPSPANCSIHARDHGAVRQADPPSPQREARARHAAPPRPVLQPCHRQWREPPRTCDAQTCQFPTTRLRAAACPTSRLRTGGVVVWPWSAVTLAAVLACGAPGGACAAP